MPIPSAHPSPGVWRRQVHSALQQSLDRPAHQQPVGWQLGCLGLAFVLRDLASARVGVPGLHMSPLIPWDRRSAWTCRLTSCTAAGDAASAAHRSRAAAGAQLMASGWGSLADAARDSGRMGRQSQLQISIMLPSGSCMNTCAGNCSAPWTWLRVVDRGLAGVLRMMCTYVVQLEAGCATSHGRVAGVRCWQPH